MSRSRTAFADRVLAVVPDDGDAMNATQIWKALGGRYGLMGLFVGPSITRIIEALALLATDGRVRERRVERAPGLFRRIYDRPAPEADKDG